MIVTALNHVAHEIKTVNKVNRNLRKIGIDPKSVPPYNRETVYDLISKDQTLSDMYKDGNIRKLKLVAYMVLVKMQELLLTVNTMPEQ